MINNSVSKMFRGIAILIVIASHYAGWMFVDPIHVQAHDWISSWGPIGVDIFFLMSGYGLVKSAYKNELRNNKADGGITIVFILKRFLSTYFPYILVIGIINTIQKQWASAEISFYKEFFSGYSYWFMNVLFIMYILFIIIWRVGKYIWIKLGVITVAILILTMRLYQMGRADFWELSNVAFLIGIYLAVAEQKQNGLMSKISTYIAMISVGLIGSVVCFWGMLSIDRMDYSGIVINFLRNISLASNEIEKVRFGWEFAFNIFFTIGIAGVAYMIPDWRGKILIFLGRNSLFIYLMHTALFWGLIFKFEEMSYMNAAIFTAFITLIISTIIGEIYDKIQALLMDKLNLRRENEK